MAKVAAQLGSAQRNDVQLDAQRGFTLIEMSLVLVIIGLIIGGIIKGEEVVANARAKSQVAQFDAIKGAIFTFQDKFGYLPGDYVGNAQLNLSIAVEGNGDGYIATSASATTAATSVTDTLAVNTASYEAQNTWLQLAATNLLAGVNTAGTALQSATTATYAGKTGNSYIWVATFASSWGVTSTIARLQAGTGTPGGIWREIDAYTTDLKFDDGTPSSGDILAGNANTYSGCISSAPSSGGVATYTLGAGTAAGSSNALSCVMEYIMQ